MQSFNLRHVLLGLLVILLAGCAAQPSLPATNAPTAVVQRSTQTPYPTATVYPTYTPYPAPSSTPTSLPTVALSSTVTATITSTAVAAIEPAKGVTTTSAITTVRPAPAPATPKPVVAPPAPKPVGVAELWHTPGTYPVSPGCKTYNTNFSSRVWEETFCITRVDIYDFGMRFYSQWKIRLLQGVFKPGIMHPRSDSAAYYLTDNLGRKYVHSASAGPADSDWPIQSPEYLLGYDDQNHHPDHPISWLQFAPAEAGATEFYYHDDEHGYVIGPIVLTR